MLSCYLALALWVYLVVSVGRFLVVCMIEESSILMQIAYASWIGFAWPIIVPYRLGVWAYQTLIKRGMGAIFWGAYDSMQEV